MTTPEQSATESLFKPMGELKKMPARALRAYARDVLEVDVDKEPGWEAETENRFPMLLNIAELHETKEVPGHAGGMGVVEDEDVRVVGHADAAEDVTKPHMTSEGAVWSGKRITIEIAEEENGSAYVTVGLDGRLFMIERGVDVSVPAELLSVLDDARITKHLFDKAGDFTGSREVPRFPYQVKGVAA